MASIKRRPDGAWRARYRDAAGKEHARHFARKVDGQRWLDEVTTSIVTGQYVDPRAGRITFRAVAEAWREAAPHGPSMRDMVERALKRHVYPVLGDRAIGSIRPSEVQAWVTGLKLAPSSAGVVLGYVSSVFRSAVQDRIIASNPAEGARPPAARKVEVFIPELAAVDVLRATLPDRYRAVVDLVIGSGLRQGEVDGLDFLRGRAIAVRQQLVSLSPNPLHVAEPKSEESRRTIPLAQRTLDVLAAHLAAHPARGVELEDRRDPQKFARRTAALVFTTPAGSAISRSMWSQIWRPAARTANLPERVGLHCLRHWYASALIAHGESVKVVQRRLGHASAAITLDVYGHLWPTSDDQTRAAVEAALTAPADSVRTEGVNGGR